MADNNSHTGADPFMQFWGDMMGKMGADASRMNGGAAAASPEMVKQMQRVFLDAMAKYADDYMRSEPFLQMMKQTLDQSLAFKRQLDQFLGTAQKGMQAPARADIDDLAGTLLKIEERVLDRLDRLESKVESMENARPTARSARASRAKRPPSRTASRKTRKK